MSYSHLFEPINTYSDMSKYHIEDNETVEIREEAIKHIASRVFKNALARLEKNPEYYELDDDEKKSMSFDIVKKSLDISYGNNLRVELIEIPTLRDELLGDESNIIVTDEDPSDETEDIDE